MKGQNMKKGLIAALSFIAGALAGGTGVYYYLNKKYDEKMDAETQELKEYFDRKYQLALDDFQGKVALYGEAEAHIKENTADDAKPKAKKTKQEKVDEAAELVERAKEEYENIVKTDYAGISAKKKSTKKKKKTEEPDGPFIISFEEYEADKKHDKRIVTYLDQENMVVDEDYEPMDDGLDLIGSENIENLELSNDEDAVFIRNNSVGTDFQVVINVSDNYDSFLEKSAN